MKTGTATPRTSSHGLADQMAGPATTDLFWANLIHWLLPTVLFFAVAIFEVAGHILLPEAPHEDNLLRHVASQILVFGLFGPTVIWFVVHWLCKVLAREVQLERAARLARTESDHLNQQMATMQRWSTSLASSLDLQRVLDSVLPICLDEMGFPLSAVLLVDEATQSLQARAVSFDSQSRAQASATPEPHPMLQHSIPLSEEDNPAVRTAITGRSCVVNGLTSLMGPRVPPARCEEIERALGIRSIGIIPLQSEQHTIGILAIGAPGRNLTSGDLIALILFANQSAVAIQNARLYETLSSTQARLRSTLEWAITAQEDERKRIARELHDETTQSLAALGLGLETAAALLSRDPGAARAQLARLKDSVVGIHTEIKRIIVDLRPSLLDDLGLIPAIRSYAEERLGQHGVAVRIRAPEEEQLFPPLIETMLFRVAQEAINNIARHAQASHVDITLKCQPEADLMLCIQDDGCGFDPEEIKNKTDQGFGLMDIRERWAIVGGIVDIESEVNKGTRVCVGLERTPNCHDCLHAQWKAGKLVCQCPERWTKQP